VKRDLIAAFIALILVAGVCYGLAAVRVDIPARPSAKLPESGRRDLTGETIVMHVNGEPVTEREFSAFLAQAPAQAQGFYASPQGRRLLADELVKLKSLEQEAHRLRLEEDPDTRTRLGMTRTNILAGLALRKLVPPMTDAKLRAEYEKERRNLESVELSHILVAYQGGQVPPRSGKPLPLPAAMERARSIAARVKGGADFAATASRESDDVNSARSGGALGPVSGGALPPDLDAVAMGLQTGQVSDPVRSDFGIHIFKAGRRTAQPFEQIREALAQRIERQEAEAAVTRVSQGAKVELDPKFFPVQPATPGQPRIPPTRQ
jgi:peptidyl-prolyl cis-trans isomerase C